MQGVFLSYAREDHELVEQLVRALRVLRYDIWFDQVLSGGQSWWDEILREIRTCDVFVIAVSPGMLQSSACNVELDYARQLQKAVLPVKVRAVRLEILPGPLAELQLVDFTSRDQDAALELASALRDLPRAGPPPSVLPNPPPPPLSYLTNLTEIVRSPNLTADNQLALVIRLEQASEKTADRPIIEELCKLLLDRDDLYYRAAKRIEKLLAGIGEAGPPVQSAAILAASDSGLLTPPETELLSREFWGSWTGTVIDFRLRYPVSLQLHDLDAQSSVGEYQYSTYGRSGWLEFKKATNDTVTLKEHALKREGLKSLMFHDGRVTLKLIDPSRIHATWTHTCHGSLKRLV